MARVEDRIAQQPLFDATIRYVEPGSQAIFYPTDRAKSYWPTEDHVMPMHDMRPLQDSLSFDRNGFLLLDRPSAVTDFRDAGEVERVYLPEVTRLVKDMTGAEQIIAFGIMVRSDASTTDDGALPSFGAHIDYGDRTVRQFSEDILGKAEADRLLKRRHFLINLWRPIAPVHRSPLALVDASTVAVEDLNQSEVRGGLGDPDRPSMYGFNLQYNPHHRWYYAPAMRPREILLFKLYDSDASSIQWTGHTAFDDPTSARDAPARTSIELRTISFMPE